MAFFVDGRHARMVLMFGCLIFYRTKRTGLVLRHTITKHALVSDSLAGRCLVGAHGGSRRIGREPAAQGEGGAGSTQRGNPAAGARGRYVGYANKAHKEIEYF